MASATFRYSPVMLFIAGAVAALLFQQGTIAILNALGYAPPPFSYTRTRPLNVPMVWSLVFWGGVWGLVYGFVESKFPDGILYWIAAFLFGAIFPVLVLWFVVFPLKGQPVAAGWDTTRMLVQVLHHGMWGLGTGIILKYRP